MPVPWIVWVGKVCFPICSLLGFLGLKLKNQSNPLLYMPPGKDRWRNTHVLIGWFMMARYQATPFGVAPSTFTTVYLCTILRLNKAAEKTKLSSTFEVFKAKNPLGTVYLSPTKGEIGKNSAAQKVPLGRDM